MVYEVALGSEQKHDFDYLGGSTGGFMIRAVSGRQAGKGSPSAVDDSAPPRALLQSNADIAPSPR
jgi:hypothetical protein